MTHPVTEDKGKRPWVEEAARSIGINLKKSNAAKESINDACNDGWKQPVVKR